MNRRDLLKGIAASIAATGVYTSPVAAVLRKKPTKVIIDTVHISDESLKFATNSFIGTDTGDGMFMQNYYVPKQAVDEGKKFIEATLERQMDRIMKKGEIVEATMENNSYYDPDRGMKVFEVVCEVVPHELG